MGKTLLLFKMWCNDFRFSVFPGAGGAHEETNGCSKHAKHGSQQDVGLGGCAPVLPENDNAPEGTDQR